jgi:hypothetical protein
VRSRDRQRRRQLSGVQPRNGSIHHAHPPHLRRAGVVVERCAPGQFQMMHRTTIECVLLRWCISKSAVRIDAIQSARSWPSFHGDRVSVDRPQPRAIGLPSRDLRGHAAVRQARRGECQISTHQRCLLLSLRKLPPARDDFDKIPANLIMAAQESALAAIDHGLRLEQGDHALDVACVLARDQEPLQVLRVAGGLPADARS